MLKYNKVGFKVGLLFTFVSFILTFTIFVPIFSVFFGFYLQLFLEEILKDHTYEEVGRITIISLSVLLCIVLISSFLRSKNLALKNLNISYFEMTFRMIIIYFIIHPWGLFMCWGFALNYVSDAQLPFNAVVTFPITSLFFIIIGSCLDWISKKHKSQLT